MWAGMHRGNEPLFSRLGLHCLPYALEFSTATILLQKVVVVVHSKGNVIFTKYQTFIGGVVGEGVRNVKSLSGTKYIKTLYTQVPAVLWSVDLLISSTDTCHIVQSIQAQSVPTIHCIRRYDTWALVVQLFRAMQAVSEKVFYLK